ncbi:MAG: hypothetical protein RL123_1808 [Pseudomonadota bacterium]
MSTLAYARMTGVPYFHTPFREIRFDDGKPDWAGRWERFFNLGEAETPLPADAVVLDASQYIAAGRPADVVVKVPHCHNFIQSEGTADAYTPDLRASFRQKYDRGSEKPWSVAPSIALHIRRGDVSADNHKGRYTSDEQILSDLKHFMQISGSDLPVEVFSQGDPSQFDFLLPHAKIALHLNSDVFETLHRMVMAQGLIMGRSAFAYVAALLTRGEVMTDIWYHRPLGEWWVPDPDGGKQRLSRLRAYKDRFARLSKAFATDPGAVVAEIESDPTYRAESPGARWLLAIALRRVDRARARSIFEELAEGQSRYAKLAASFLRMRYYSKTRPHP